jgi:hypothetical protein
LIQRKKIGSELLRRHGPRGPAPAAQPTMPLDRLSPAPPRPVARTRVASL